MMGKGFAPAACLTLCLAAVASCVAAERRVVPMKEYNVDINDPPRTRWNHILSHYNSSVPLLLKYCESEIPKEMLELVKVVMARFDELLGEVGQELKGIAEYWNVDLGLVVGLNFAYEFRMLGGGPPNITNGSNGTNASPVLGCTSIVARKEHIKSYHGRNMDWDLPNDLRNVTILVNYYRGDQLLFKGVTFAGFVGVLTTVSPKGFSVSLNERGLGGNPIEDAIMALLFHKARDPSFLLREVSATAQSYSSALEQLTNSYLMSPTYYIIAGPAPDFGAVISRGRFGAVDVENLGKMPENWYLLETNYDHWKPVYPNDNRRYYGNKYMTELGPDKGASLQGIYSVLSTWPVWNRYTAHTAVMDPQEFEIEAYVVYK